MTKEMNYVANDGKRRDGMKTVCPVCEGKEFVRDYGNTIVKHVITVYPEEALFLAFYQPLLMRHGFGLKMENFCRKNFPHLKEKYEEYRVFVQDGTLQEFPLAAEGEFDESKSP